MKANLRILAPNSLTLLSSLSALVALYVAYVYQERNSAYWLLLCGLFDALDGPLARRLKAQSRFGSQYDTLSDFLAFGVAPAFVLYFLGLIDALPAAFYILAIQFRLTRFAAETEAEMSEKFFRGLSAPDCVYVGFLLGYLPFSNFNWGFGAAGVLAILPWRFWPKGYRVVKIALGVLATYLFVRNSL